MKKLTISIITTCLMLVMSVCVFAEGNVTLRPIPELVKITDIENNNIFEILKETGEPSDIEYISVISTRNVKTASGYYDGMKYEPYGAGGYFVDIDGNQIQFVIDESALEQYGYAGLELFDNCTYNSLRLRDNKLYSCGYIFISVGNSKFNHGYQYCYDVINNIMYELPLEFLMVSTSGNANACMMQEEDIGGGFKRISVAKGYKIQLINPPVVSVFYKEKDKYVEQKVNFDQIPVIENGRTLVPLRAIFEKLGADIKWDEETHTVTATKDATTISLTIGSTTAMKNGEAITLEAPAKVENGRTLVPVRFIADSFNIDIKWDSKLRRVTLFEKD